jgi:hypothetical protein
MKLTKEEKQLCIDKWQWFYDNAQKNLSDRMLPAEIRKQSSEYHSNCVLCSKFGGNEDHLPTCSFCPVCIYGIDCYNGDSYYQKCFNARNKTIAKKYAGKLLEIMKSL